MDEKQYFIDDNPASARDIINLAKDYDEEFAKSGFYQTSVAAEILRKNGHEIK